MKLLCDICGGQLQMNGTNREATCVNCGMNYSVESLRNKLNAQQVTDDAKEAIPDEPVCAAEDDAPIVEAEIVEEDLPLVPASHQVDGLMTVEDVFAIALRGTVITGTVQNGTISVGESVVINNKTFVVEGLENCKKMISTASQGMDVGMLLKGAKKKDFKPGDWVYKKA